MNMLKLVTIAGLLVVFAFPVTRESASLVVQSTVLNSGFVDASTSSSKRDLFDFDFSVKDLSGNTVDFKNFRGKIVFLNLWATWCGPCRSEMPSIQKLYEGIGKEKVSFVMLSLDDERLSRKVKSFTERNGFTFPVFTNTGQLTEQLQVPSIPTTFVIDRDGYVVLKEVGMRNYDTPKFKKYLEQLAEK